LDERRKKVLDVHSMAPRAAPAAASAGAPPRAAPDDSDDEELSIHDKLVKLNPGRFSLSTEDLAAKVAQFNQIKRAIREVAGQPRPPPPPPPPDNGGGAPQGRAPPQAPPRAAPAGRGLGARANQRDAASGLPQSRTASVAKEARRASQKKVSPSRKFAKEMHQAQRVDLSTAFTKASITRIVRDILVKLDREREEGQEPTGWRIRELCINILRSSASEILHNLFEAGKDLMTMTKKQTLMVRHLQVALAIQDQGLEVLNRNVREARSKPRQIADYQRDAVLQNSVEDDPEALQRLAERVGMDSASAEEQEKADFLARKKEAFRAQRSAQQKNRSLNKRRAEGDAGSDEESVSEPDIPGELDQTWEEYLANQGGAAAPAAAQAPDASSDWMG
jgi:histone H3/H4